MNGGILSSFKTSTGDLIFRERIKAPGAYMASPVFANNCIYLIAHNGKVTVIKPGDKVDIISRSDLKENISASPVALGNTFLVRTTSALYAFSK